MNHHTPLPPYPVDHSPSTETLTRRRLKAGAGLGDHVGLIMSGLEQPRNFRANVYGPFRASSHFLYLVGASIPNAVFLLDAYGGSLYLPRDSFSESLWHGPSLSFSTLSQRFGCPVYDIATLDTRLKSSVTYGLPQAQLNTRHQQEVLLGRPFSSELDQPLMEAMINARLVHDEEGIRALRLAAQLTRDAHFAGLRATHPGAWCHEIRAAMERPLTHVGCTPAYAPIITPHGEILHNHNYHVQLNSGDLLLVDFGAETRGGWAGDVTRTWPVSGSWSSTQRDIYDVVLAALEATIAVAQPKTEYRELHAEASRVLIEGLIDLRIIKGSVDEALDANAHALFFPHGIGHLLGLDVHDMEDLGDLAGYAKGRRRSERFGWGYLRLDRKLEAGMAITIEPGFYQVDALLKTPSIAGARVGDLIDWDRLAAFKDTRGIRIEDDLIITKTGHEVLSAEIPKDPEELLRFIGDH